MISLKISSNQLSLADKLVDKTGGYRHNIRDCYASEYDMLLTGALGEVLVKHYFSVPLDDGSFSYDLVVHGHRVEVKSTLVSYEPKPYFDARVNGYIRQDTDYYLFVYISRNWKDAWLGGVCHREDIIKQENYHEKGSPMPQGGFWKGSAYTIPISQLKPLNTLKNTAVSA